MTSDQKRLSSVNPDLRLNRIKPTVKSNPDESRFSQIRSKPALVEKCGLAASIVICKLGVAVELSFLRLRVHSAFLYLRSLATPNFRLSIAQ